VIVWHVPPCDGQRVFQIELPARSFSGDRGTLERQLALNPDAVPEPPQLVSNDRPVGRIALLISSFDVGCAKDGRPEAINVQILEAEAARAA
jgi:hypothetical protein